GQQVSYGSASLLCQRLSVMSQRAVWVLQLAWRHPAEQGREADHLVDVGDQQCAVRLRYWRLGRRQRRLLRPAAMRLRLGGVLGGGPSPRGACLRPGGGRGG